jgi:hypothetical protein
MRANFVVKKPSTVILVMVCKRANRMEHLATVKWQFLMGKRIEA